MSIKIVDLPLYTGPAAPAGFAAITYAGTTFKIPISALVKSGTGSGSMNRLAEFTVGKSGYVIGAPGSPLSDDETYNNTSLANVNGVLVFAGGTLVPNIPTVADAPMIVFIPGSTLLSLTSGFYDGTHILILTY